MHIEREFNKDKILIVRNATISDSSKLLALIEHKAAFDRNMKGFEGNITTNVTKIEQTLFCDSPYAYALLLESDNKTLGFAIYHFRYSSFKGEPSIWLDDLFVMEHQRSKGCGIKLMNALQKRAQETVASHISWTASPNNIRAHQFYEKLGAVIELMDNGRPYFYWRTIGEPII